MNLSCEKAHVHTNHHLLPQSSRRLRWVSALDENNSQVLYTLQKKLQTYYKEMTYYNNIDKGSQLWHKLTKNPLHKKIATTIQGLKVLEIGCGSSRILQTGFVHPRDYTGCDFSECLMERNRERHPEATFKQLLEKGKLPFPDRSFDAVFSIFVIEHAVYPQIFINESVRILRPGGAYFILCPDFLGKSRMTSQRVGLSMGSGRAKVRQGKLIDACLTALDQRVRIPLKCHLLRLAASRNPRCFINVAPICFEESTFIPDIDAVYLTYEPEIKSLLENDICNWQNDAELRSYADKMRLIFLHGIKNKS